MMIDVMDMHDVRLKVIQQFADFSLGFKRIDSQQALKLCQPGVLNFKASVIDKIFFPRRKIISGIIHRKHRHFVATRLEQRNYIQIMLLGSAAQIIKFVYL